MSQVGDEGGIGDWEMALLERACEGKAVSAGERCLGHQEGGEKERTEDGLEEREPGTVNAL